MLIDLLLLSIALVTGSLSSVRESGSLTAPSQRHLDLDGTTFPPGNPTRIRDSPDPPPDCLILPFSGSFPFA